MGSRSARGIRNKGGLAKAGGRSGVPPASEEDIKSFFETFTTGGHAWQRAFIAEYLTGKVSPKAFEEGHIAETGHHFNAKDATLLAKIAERIPAEIAKAPIGTAFRGLSRGSKDSLAWDRWVSVSDQDAKWSFNNEFKVGTVFSMAGPTSFTTKESIGVGFAKGTVDGAKSNAAGRYKALIRVNNAPLLNIEKYSPFKQAEVVTMGKFKVTGVTRDSKKENSRVREFLVVDIEAIGG